MDNTIIFDMDGVLFDTERICCECWDETGREKGVGGLYEGIKGCIGMNRADAMVYLAAAYGEDFPFKELNAAVRVRIRQRISEEGLPLKKGVLELLHYLRENNYIIGLASSTSKKSVMEYLERAGIVHFFREVITGDMVEHSKPMPDIYLMICEALGANPENTIAIEDSPNGVLSAYRAGMKPIMVPDLIEPDKDTEAMLYKKFSSLLEVMDYLKGV